MNRNPGLVVLKCEVIGSCLWRNKKYLRRSSSFCTYIYLSRNKTGTSLRQRLLSCILKHKSGFHFRQLHYCSQLFLFYRLSTAALNREIWWILNKVAALAVEVEMNPPCLDMCNDFWCVWSFSLFQLCIEFKCKVLVPDLTPSACVPNQHCWIGADIFVRLSLSFRFLYKKYIITSSSCL